MTSAALHRLAERQRGIERILNAAFHEQRAFILDRSRQKYLICPRRAGKSEGDALDLFYTAFRWDAVRCVYIGLVRQTAKDIMWDKFKEIAKRLCLFSDDGQIPRGIFNESELSIRIPHTNSVIQLKGMDANKNEPEKVLGGKYKLVVVDEAASFRIDLEAFVRDNVSPATDDERGTVALTGTPDPDEARGFFYDVTTGKIGGWSEHRWDTLQNPHMAEQRLEKLATILRENPLYIETPAYKCMYLAEWPDDPSGWVYRFDRTRNLCIAADVPKVEHRVISIDLGWKDDCSIVESCWSPFDKTLYYTSAEKAAGIYLDEIDQRIRRVRDSRPGMQARLVIDGANAQVVNELRKRYGLPLIAAEKSEKAVFIRMMNTEMICGRVKVVRDACTPLIAEWSGADEDGTEVKGATPLVWDKQAMERKPPRLVEDPRCPNHASDAALYAWRYAWNHLSKPAEDAIRPGTEAEALALLAERRRRVEREKREED